MDGLTSATEIIKAFLGSWPLALVVVVVVLKNPIAALLKDLGDRIQKIKGKASGVELEADFGKSVDKIAETVPLDKILLGTNNVEELKLKEELARLPPGYLVSQAWLKLENAVREVIDEDFAREDAKTPGAIRSRFSSDAYFNLVTVHGILPYSDVDAIKELGQLRNKAVHDLDPNISVTDALRYTDIANSLVEKIKAYRDRKISRPILNQRN